MKKSNGIGGNITSEYSMLEATIETYIDIEGLGITDFDDLTDEQVLGCGLMSTQLRI